MKKLKIPAVVILLLVSCNNPVTPLLIRYDDVERPVSEAPGTSEAEIRVYDDAYLDITLSKLAEKNFHIANKKTQSPKVENGIYTMKSITITDEAGKAIKFSTSSEFLKYMHDRGYDMVSKEENKLSIDYIFKRN